VWRHKNTGELAISAPYPYRKRIDLLRCGLSPRRPKSSWVRSRPTGSGSRERFEHDRLCHEDSRAAPTRPPERKAEGRGPCG
jgi:hypothetical protein